MANKEVLGRGHTMRVMPTPEQQRVNRALVRTGMLVLVIGLIWGMRFWAQTDWNMAARNGDVATLRQLQASAFYINRVEALNEAIAFGRGNVVRYLLAQKLVKPDQGLDTAAQQGQGAILRVLLENGAKVRGEAGGRLLWRAAQSGDKETVQLLVRYGADRNLPNPSDDGLTPVMYAAHSGKPGVVKTLLDAGASPRARATNGRTALMIAAAWNQPAACKYLLNAGADINARDSRGQTALMSATVVGNHDALEYLLNSGASLQIKDKAGKSVLDHAIQTGDDRCLNILRRARGTALAHR